jgi:ribosomal protein S27AE
MDNGNQNGQRAQQGNCPKCHQGRLMTEALGEGKVRKSCGACGFNEVNDQQGRQLLTDDLNQGAVRTEQVAPTGPQYLVEG